MPFVTQSSRPTVVVGALPARPEIDPPARRQPTPPVQPDAINALEEPDPDKKAGNYDIGYKRPPKHGQFKKGVSGNPKGRPKGAKGMKAIVRAVLTEKLPVRTPNGVKARPIAGASVYAVTTMPSNIRWVKRHLKRRLRLTCVN